MEINCTNRHEMLSTGLTQWVVRRMMVTTALVTVVMTVTIKGQMDGLQSTAICTWQGVFS